MYENKLYPWLNVWIHPRKTVSWILGTGPHKIIYAIIVLYGLALNLDRSIGGSFGDNSVLWMTIAAAAITAPVIGFVFWFIESHLLYWFGKLLGGTAERREVREVFAWFGIFYIAKAIVVLAQVPFIGNEIFTSVLTESNPALILPSFFLSGVNIGLTIWFYVNISLALGEVNGFSGWRGFFTLLFMLITMFVLGTIYKLILSLLFTAFM